LETTHCPVLTLPERTGTGNTLLWYAARVPVQKLTDFFPGIAHSQLIRFRLPSAFLTGLATKPYEQAQ